MLPPLRSTLFPYTTLFRSRAVERDRPVAGPRRIGAEDPRLRLDVRRTDRKSTRLNSSHMSISYAVFCVKKNTRLQSCTIPAFVRGIMSLAIPPHVGRFGSL